ncbi:hypothetical protein GCM10010121_095780 [Streptomyces brasiliensis]|uniref:Uncharacterized protein n=2 Tax=Streptomyces brasiliensis TaxID=1954 RepID=A0A917PBT9_9ACTN|nr:hypothetical protein GCM10010121_095780 [Streptomyces brasiliensis]
MAQVAIADLLRVIAAVPGWRERGSNGVRLVYDGSRLVLSTADRPDEVLARASTRGHATEAWELTMYATSLPGVRVWLSSLDGEQLVDVSPFWAGTPALVVFTASGGHMTFPVIDCPSAPARRRAFTGGADG